MLMLLQQTVFQGLGTGYGPPVVFTGADGTSNVTNSSTTIAPAKPTATIEGMLLLAAMAAKGGVRTWTGDTSWDERVDHGALPNLRIATKIATSSEAASYTFTASVSSDLTAIVVAISHAAYDTIGTAGTRSGTGTLTAPAITMSQGGLLLAIVAMEGSGGAIASDSSMPLIKNYGSGVYPEISIFGEYVGSGSTGTRAFTIGGTSPSACSAYLVGIKKG